MNQTYFSLALKTKQKKPKKVCFKYEHYSFSYLNNILNVTLKNVRWVKSSNPQPKLKILRLLDKIIPDEYFGTRLHRKLFYEIVKKILTQSAYECIYSSSIVKGYNYNSIPWLREIKCSKTCREILLKINKFLLEHVVKRLVTFYYKSLKTNNGHEIRFYRKGEWDKFQTKVLNHLKASKVLVKVQNTHDVRSRGFFKIIPKGPLQALNFRPIVNSARTENTRFLRSIVTKIYQAAKDTNKHFSTSLYDDWLSFVRKIGDRQLYGAKFDVEDAFGNVDISFLCNTIQGIRRKFLEKNEKTFLIQYIKNQFVTFKKHTYRWQRGLLQGDVLSAALCELYMARWDEIFIEKLSDECFLHRTVDDYFYCSTEAYKVERFVGLMRQVHKINKDKTITNLGNSCEEIPYCGKVFNLRTKEVRVLYSFPDGYEIRHKFKLWDFRRPISETDCSLFLRKAMVISFCSNYFGKMELNTIFNSQKTVLENFFNAMIYVAYKFDATIMTLRNNYLLDDFDGVYSVLINCIKPYVLKARKTIKFYEGKYCKTKITFRLLLILALKAFVLVLKRRNEIYKNLIVQIKKEFNLKVDFRDPDVDFKYFNMLPSCLGHVTINRKVVI